MSPQLEQIEASWSMDSTVGDVLVRWAVLAILLTVVCLLARDSFRGVKGKERTSTTNKLITSLAKPLSAPEARWKA